MIENFSLNEFTITSTGIDNTPTQIHRERLKTLCVKVLQPLRDLYGKPIIVTSGYRIENGINYVANVVTIDTTNRVIKIKRVGFNMDKFLRPINYLTYDYKNKKIITNY